MTVKSTEHANYFLKHPPRCIRAFLCNRADESGNPNLTPESLYSSFDLECPCGNPAVRVLGYNWTNPDSGQSVFIGPIRTHCENCTATELVFDIRHHGYDAELGNGCWSARGEGEPEAYRCIQCSAEKFAVNAFLDFTDDLFDDGFEDMRGRECDLFHWVSITGACADCGTKQLICDYECA